MEQQQGLPGQSRYRAFISYSHTDADFASWLHRRIEDFRLPAAPGEAPQRLSPVFIDRAELPAASDLSEQVKAALAGSAALIVIASPRARASRWVDQEIALFRTLNPGRPILVALIEGEPDEAFPPSLTQHEGRTIEPLAADFRKHADGRKLGLLKIVAGLSDLPLDRLVQRDAQARQRRVMAITGAAVLLSVVLLALLVSAIRARAEAERQRASAEGMVEFMLTDLRADLKGVAGLKVMDQVNARAMAHYSQQDLSGLPADSLTRRARLLHAMGEDEAGRGHYAKAQAKFAEAARTTAAVLAQRQTDADAIFAHAQSEFWVGYAAWQRLDLLTTQKHWGAYLTQAQALASREPGTLRSLSELGYANGNLCELSMAQHSDPARALPYCEKATQFFRQAVARPDANDQTRLDLANRIGWQSDVLDNAGDLTLAIKLRREEAAILDALLRADPTNFQLRERRLWPEIGLVDLEAKTGETPAALLRAQRAMTNYEQLSRERSDDMGLLGQRLRLAYIAYQAAAKARMPDARLYASTAEQTYARLRQALPPAELRRFTIMITKMRRLNQ